MAMPIGSIIEKFRAELEAEIEAARERADGRSRSRRRRRSSPAPRPLTDRAPMPRPEQKIIQLTIDGREVQAIEGAMLVDAAKQGDVEIPYFCYEPKLGKPVGACRMCLVEIEGIPKLQTSCSTPVKDGMVVHTQTERVRTPRTRSSSSCSSTIRWTARCATRAASARCRTSRSAGARAQSRVVEPKRHFEKPLALSPLIAIDRERCILCYRCVRFSQEIAEDWQLIFAERGAHTFVGTHDGHPYVAPFSGNIIELCPVGRADLAALPLPRAAVGHRGRGRNLHAMPVPVQRRVHRPRREGRARAGARATRESTTAGCATRAASPTRRSTSTSGSPGRSCATAASCARSPGSARSRRRPCSPPRGRVGALVGGQATNEEGFLLQRLLREGLDSHDIDSRAGAPARRSARRAALATPALQARVPDLEFAHTVLVVGCEPLDDAPILDLRIRKGVRRNGVKLAIATARPSALDPNADADRPLRPRRGGRVPGGSGRARCVGGGAPSGTTAALAELAA